MSVESSLIQYKAFFETSPVIKLLTSRHATFTLTSLDYIFQEESRVERREFISKLSLVIDRLRQSGEFEPGQDAHDYLRLWIESGYLLDREQYIHVLDSVIQAKRVIEDNAVRSIDGTTQTQLTVVQNLLSELVSQVSENPEDRVALLQERIAEAEHEIERIKKGEFKPLKGSGAIERVRHFFQQAKRLQNDFRYLEQELRDSARSIRVNMKTEEVSKGSVLKTYLRQVKDLNRTPSGQAFSGFYKVLSRPALRNLFQDNIIKLIQADASSEALTQLQITTLKNLMKSLTHQANQFHDARRQTEASLKDFIEREQTEDTARVRELLSQLDALTVQRAKEVKIYDLRTTQFIDSVVASAKLKAQVHMNLNAPEEPFDPTDIPEQKTFNEHSASEEMAKAISMPNAKKSFKLITKYLEHESPLSLENVVKMHSFKNAVEFISFSQIFFQASNDEKTMDQVEVPVRTQDGRHLVFTVPTFQIEKEHFPETYEELIANE